MMKRNIIVFISMFLGLFVANHTFSMDRKEVQVFVTRINNNKKFACYIEYNTQTQTFSSFDVYAAVEKALQIPRNNFTIFITGEGFQGPKELSKRTEESFPVRILYDAQKGSNAFLFKAF